MLQEEPQREQPAATPVKKARLRPLSEQLLGRSYPRPSAHDDDEGWMKVSLFSILSYSSLSLVLNFIVYRSTFNS